MRPRTIGRALGIGVRVAGRIAGQRIMGPVQSVAGAPQAQPQPKAVAAGSVIQEQTARQAGYVAAQAGRAVSQGVGGFLRPFRRAGRILWLEVTGVFFLLPVIVFAPTLWRSGMAYSHSGDHRTFWITALIMAVFLYLGVSSFWRARRR